MEPIRLLICDDHPVFRQGLRAVLEEQPDIQVVGEAESAADAIAKAEEMIPDVVLMDIKMEGSGIAATAAINEQVPRARILMLTASEEEEDLYESIRAGASGYLLKGISLEEVLEAIRGAHSGLSLISSSMAGKLLNEFSSSSKAPKPEETKVPSVRLTERELEVLQLMANGMGTRDIASKLTITEHTVKKHTQNILEKFHLHSRVDAVVHALREGIVTIE